jgi:cytochrome c biogenesis protein CcdA
MVTQFCDATSVLNPQNLAIPAVVAAGLVDGINPCAIGMLVFLLGYLIVFAERQQAVLRTGLAYIGTVFTTYFLIGLVFYQTVSVLMASPPFVAISQWFRGLLGLGLIAVGLASIRGVNWGIPDSARPRLHSLVERRSLPATVLLAVLVTVLETPCSFPLYAGAVGILSRCNLSSFGLLGYLLLYNLLFVLPLVLILGLVYAGVGIPQLKEWEHRHQRKMRLLMGVVLVFLGLVLILF